MKYSLYVVINRANGTDYELDVREYQGSEALIRGIEASISLADRECLDETGHGPNSIVLTVIPS